MDNLFTGLSAISRGTWFELKNSFNHRSMKSTVKDCFEHAWNLMEVCMHVIMNVCKYKLHFLHPIQRKTRKWYCARPLLVQKNGFTSVVSAWTLFQMTTGGVAAHADVVETTCTAHANSSDQMTRKWSSVTEPMLVCDMNGITQNDDIPGIHFIVL